MNELVDALSAHAENQFMAQGMILILFGGIMTLLRSVPFGLYYWVKRKMFASVEIMENRDAFDWVNSWCADNIGESWMNRAFIGDFWQTSKVGQQDYLESSLAPAVGVRVFFHNKRMFMLHRSRVEKDYASNGTGFIEKITIYAFRLSHIVDLVREAHTLSKGEVKAIYVVHTVGEYGWLQKQIPFRSLDSVVLPEELKVDITSDVKSFLGEESWYRERNLEYNRGCILVGPPGTGKTSIVRALASELSRPIYTFDLSSIKEPEFIKNVRRIPSGSIVLFEDIDSIYKGREYIPKLAGGTSFSTFINAIDGVMTPSGLIKIFTTNHLEHLDPALLRPGRCDRVFKFGNADAYMAETLFLRMFPKNEALAKLFSVKGGTGKFSMATLQEHLLRYRSGAEIASSTSIAGSAVVEQLKVPEAISPGVNAVTL